MTRFGAYLQPGVTLREQSEAPPLVYHRGQLLVRVTARDRATIARAQAKMRGWRLQEEREQRYAEQMAQAVERLGEMDRQQEEPEPEELEEEELEEEEAQVEDAEQPKRAPAVRAGAPARTSRCHQRSHGRVGLRCLRQRGHGGPCQF